MESFFVPQIISNDIQFSFKRLQFLVRLAFGMTINKAVRPIYRLMWLASGGSNMAFHLYNCMF